MYNPQLASFIGLTFSDIIVSLAYLFIISLIRKESNLSRDLLPLLIFLVLKISTNYYLTIYAAGIMLLLSPVIVLYDPNEQSYDTSSFLLISSVLIIASSIVYYIFPQNLIGFYITISGEEFPKEIMGEYSKYVVPYDVSFGVIGVLMFFIISTHYFIKFLKKEILLNNFLLGFGYNSYVYAVIIITILLGDGSHLVYGLSIMIFGIVLSTIIDNNKVSLITFSAGAMLALDDVIGYALYPEYSPFPLFVDRVLSPMIFIILIILFVFLNEDYILTKLKRD